MSWSQGYHTPNRLELLEKILGVSALTMLEAEMSKRGLKILQEETFILVDDPYYGTVESQKVTISDGRVLEPKLVRTVRYDDGGYDHYAWCEAKENPKVIRESHYPSNSDD